MRILHAYKIYRPDIDGGIPAVMSSLSRSSDKDLGQSILCARRRGTARMLDIDGVPVEAVGSFGTLFSTPMAPGYIPAFMRQARAADVVVHHAPLPLTDMAILLGLPRDVALVVYWHAEIIGFPLLKKLVSPMIRRVLARADRIVVSGQPVIDHSEFLGPHVGKCMALPYGMDLEYWRTLDAEDHAAIGALLRAHPRHIVALGRLVGYKGFDILIDAMRDVDGSATIIGEGPLLGELRHLASERGVAEKVHFAGRLPRRSIKQMLHAARIFAFPSVSAAEAFGIVQIEAMAAGLPIVNTDLPTTVPLVARDGLEALTVAPGDTEQLSRALTRLLDDPAFARKLGTSGAARAFGEFDEKLFGSRMRDIYRQAIDARRILNNPH